MRLLTALLLLPLLAAAEHRSLLPRPREVRYGTGSLSLRGASIRLGSAANAEDRFAASLLRSALSLDRSTGSGPEIILRRTPRQIGNSPEGYSIKVTPGGAEIAAGSAAGLFYGVQTMRQLATGGALPEVEIRDWPALPYRGFMMDISQPPRTRRGAPLPRLRQAWAWLGGAPAWPVRPRPRGASLRAPPRRPRHRSRASWWA